MLLPNELTVVSKWPVLGLEGAMLVSLVVASPFRIESRHAARRLLALTLAGVVSVANAIALALLVHYLLRHNPLGGHRLVIAGSEIWLTNVLVFALWYWEMDRGGPGDRAVLDTDPPDFLFPQMTDDRIGRGWQPQFADYLYVSLTNATAFSPTDTMPLTVNAKLMMGLQSLVSLVTIGLVIARAVNIL